MGFSICTSCWLWLSDGWENAKRTSLRGLDSLDSASVLLLPPKGLWDSYTGIVCVLLHHWISDNQWARRNNLTLLAAHITMREVWASRNASMMLMSFARGLQGFERDVMWRWTPMCLRNCLVVENHPFSRWGVSVVHKRALCRTDYGAPVSQSHQK